MGRFGDWIRKLFGGNGNPGVLGSAVNKYTGSGLTGAEMAANQFSHNEAELARQWQEDFYNQYQSPAAQVRQYQEAGLNPALMYGSAPSASPVSSPSPSSVSPSSESLLSILPGLSKIKAEIDAIRADADLKRRQGALVDAQAAIERIHAETEGPLRALERQLKEHDLELKDIEIKYNPVKYDQALRRGEIDIEQARLGCAKILREISQLQADTYLTYNKNRTESLIQGLTVAQRILAEQNAGYVSYQALNEKWVYEFRSQYGFDPGYSIWQMFPTALAYGLGGLRRGADKAAGFLSNVWKKGQNFFSSSPGTNYPIR